MAMIAPPQFFTLEQCKQYSSALAGCLSRLGAMGVRVPDLGRLRKELSSIESVVHTEQWPTEESAQITLANAFSDASDFVDVMQFLPSEPSKGVIVELQRVMKGSASDERVSSAAYRFQSQIWLRAMLSLGGYDPRIPDDTDGKNPDYLVEEGTISYGVEIKRPANAKSALGLLREGANQLREYGVRGAIVCDLSECVGLPSLSWVTYEQLEKAQRSVRDKFEKVQANLRATVIDERRNKIQRGMDSVLALFCFARAAHWVSGDSSGATLFAAASAHSFVRPIRDVRHYHSLNLNSRITRGLIRAGFPFQDFMEVARPSPGFPGKWPLK